MNKILFSSIINLCGYHQVSNYIAVAKKIRKAMDDWINPRDYRAYLTLMKKIGLRVKVDCVFADINNAKDSYCHISPTTNAKGKKFVNINECSKDDKIHVVVSAQENWLDEAFAYCWYPLIIKGKIVSKPRIDHYNLGLSFGYPKCCSDMFFRNNNWLTNSHIYSSFLRSKKLIWSTNHFLQYTKYMLNFHIPCKFDCESSVKMGMDIFASISKLDSAYADNILSYLHFPILFISEYFSFIFTEFEHCDKYAIRYTRSKLLCKSTMQNESRIKNINILIQNSDEVRIDENYLVILKNGDIVATLQPTISDNVIETPLILFFE